MAGLMGVSVNVDDSDVRSGLKRLQLAGKSLRPVFQRLKKPFKEDIRAHQRSKESPEGLWAPRAPSTKARDKHGKTSQLRGGKTRKTKRRRRPRILGRLPTSVTTKQKPDAFIGESKIPWAMAHQEGARVGRGSVLPARPFLFFSPGFLDQAEAEISEHLRKGWLK